MNTQKDLNIYKEIFTDQKDEKPSCCQPEGTACESTKPVDATVKDAAEIDFNEWAGKCFSRWARSLRANSEFHQARSRFMHSSCRI